jgi:hypothetical protein
MRLYLKILLTPAALSSLKKKMNRLNKSEMFQSLSPNAAFACLGVGCGLKKNSLRCALYKRYIKLKLSDQVWISPPETTKYIQSLKELIQRYT